MNVNKEVTHGSRACQWAGAQARARPRARARARGGAEGGWRGARCCRRTAPQPLPRRSLALRSGNSVHGGVPLSPGTRLPPPGPAQVQSRGATLVRTDPRPWVGVGQGGEEARRPRASLPEGLGEPQPRTPCPLPSWNRKGKARRPALSAQPFARAQRGCSAGPGTWDHGHCEQHQSLGPQPGLVCV